MNIYLEKKVKRNNMKKRSEKIRFKLKKVSNRKRLTVFKSNSHLYAQLIDDSKGSTLASASSIIAECFALTAFNSIFLMLKSHWSW